MNPTPSWEPPQFSVISGIDCTLLVAIRVRKSTTAELTIWGKFLRLEITTNIQAHREIYILSLNQTPFLIAFPTPPLPEFLWSVF